MSQPTTRKWLPAYCHTDNFLPPGQETVILMKERPYFFPDFVGRALAFLRLQLNCPAVTVDDGVNDGQAQTGPVFLGSIKGVEGTQSQLVVHADAGVFDLGLNHRNALRPRRQNSQIAAHPDNRQVNVVIPTTEQHRSRPRISRFLPRLAVVSRIFRTFCYKPSLAMVHVPGTPMGVPQILSGYPSATSISFCISRKRPIFM